MSETPGAPRRIRKRDGRIVPFDTAKIVGAVRAAQAAVEEEDPGLGSEVAELVVLELVRRGARPAGGQPPTIEEVQDLVEQALIELGRVRVAKSYILYRDRRSRAREALAVAPSPRVGGRLLVRESGGVQPWDKSRIVAALLEEGEVPRATAERVAGRVEERVLRSGLRRVTTTLVREMVASELAALGLERAMRRHEPVGMPRGELERRVAAARAGGEPAEERVGGALLERRLLGEVLPEEIADRILTGDLDLVDRSRPTRPLALALPAELIARGRPGARAAFDALDALAPLARAVARELALEGAAALLSPLVRGARADATSALVGWLLAARALARAAGVRLSLARVGSRSAAFLARLVEDVDRVSEAEDAAWGPLLRLDEEELTALLAQGRPAREAAGRLLARGLLRPLFGRGGCTEVAPGCIRREGEHGALALGAIAAVPLQRIARGAGPWREDLALERIGERAGLAAAALAALDGARASAFGPLAGLRPRLTYAVAPIGLREALLVLADGEIRPSQGARLLGVLAEGAARAGAEAGLAIGLASEPLEEAARRLAALDAARPAARQPLLFAPPDPEGHGPPKRYSAGFELGRLPQIHRGEALAALLATVPAGALPPPDPDHGPAVDLDDWETFVRARANSRAEAEREHVLVPYPRSPRVAAPLFGEAAEELRPEASRPCD